MPSHKRKSLQDVLKERQKETARDVFVGRGDELKNLIENLARPASKRHWYIFNIHGQAGVGKSFLIRRFRQLAQTKNAITARIDEDQRSVVEVMARISDELATEGKPLKAFAERYRAYRQRRSELELDPEAPQGIAEFIGRGVTRAGLAGGQLLGAGPLLAFVNNDDLVAKGGECLAYVVRKLSNKDEVRLVREPIEVLTPLWLEGLWEQDAARSILLFFDAHERTSDYLDEWLMDLLSAESPYGELPENLLFGIAGQSALDRERWRDLESIISRMPLESFSEEETREYLSHKGLADADFATKVFQMTRGLPVLVALLASGQAYGERLNIDANDTAVGLFLKGMDSEHRKVALDAALPRRLNRDVLSCLEGADKAGVFFDWLKKKPFVDMRSDGWVYHQVVRHHMLALKRRESRQEWAELHRKLNEHYQQLGEQMGLVGSRRYQDEEWRNHELEAIYHQLCANPHRNRTAVLGNFLSALKVDKSFAAELASTIAQAETDSAIPQELRWGEKLASALKEQDETRIRDAAELFQELAKEEGLTPQGRAIALDWRGYILGLIGYREEALASLTAALELDPGETEYLTDRGRVLFRMERYEEALSDLDQVIKKDPKASKSLHLRSMIQMARGQYEAALADMDQLAEFEPNDPAQLYMRMLLMLKMGNIAQASTASTQLKKQIPQYVEQIRKSADLLKIESTQKELLNLLQQTLGVGITPQQSEVFFNAFIQGKFDAFVPSLEASLVAIEALAHEQNAQPEEAIAAFTKALELDASEPQHWLGRARNLEQQGRFELARSDYNKAAELAPGLAEVFIRRAGLLVRLQCHAEALRDLDSALYLQPDTGLFIQRSALHTRVGNVFAAVMDMEQVIERKPDDFLLMFNLFILQLTASRTRDAAATYKRIAENAPAFVQQLRERFASADPSAVRVSIEHWFWSVGFSSNGRAYAAVRSLAERMCAMAVGTPEFGIRAVRSDALAVEGAFLRQSRQYDEALERFSTSLELDPSYVPHWTERAQTYRAMGRQQEFVDDLRSALAVKTTSTTDLLLQAAVCLQLGRFEKALELSSLVVEFEPAIVNALALRGHAHQMLGRYQDALADLDRLTSLEPAFIKDLRNLRGELLACIGRYADARECFNEALAGKTDELRATYNLVILKVREKGSIAAQAELSSARQRLLAVENGSRNATIIARRGGLEAVAGNVDEALELLHQAVILDPQVAHMANIDLAWRELRSDPRFLSMLEKALSKSDL